MFGGSATTAWAQRLGAPPPQFIDPSTGQVNPQIVSETHDAMGVHVTYNDGAQAFNGDAVSSLPRPADGKTGVASDDFQAFIANHGQPVVVPLDQMVASTSGVATEAGPWVTQPGCVGPPANFNIATATDAQLALYGFPAVGTMPRNVYDAKFSWMKHRNCQLRALNNIGANHALTGAKSAHSQDALRPQGNPTVRQVNPIWTGNVADEYECSSNGYTSGLGCPVGTPNTYSEADTDWYVPTLTYPGGCYPECTSSYWVGLGGTAGQYELIQTGVEGDTYCAPDCWYSHVTPWVEWVGNAGTVGEQGINVSGIGQGTHVFSRVTYPNTYELGNIDTQQFTTVTEGPTGAENSAEFIVEDVNSGGIDYGLTKFSTFTFYGVGVTDQSGYYAMSYLVHDYVVDYWQANSPQLTNIGSINNDPSDYPYDEFGVSWLTDCAEPCA